MNSTGEIIDSTGGFYRGRLIGYDRMMENSFEYILSPLRLPGLFFLSLFYLFSFVGFREPCRDKYVGQQKKKIAAEGRRLF